MWNVPFVLSCCGLLGLYWRKNIYYIDGVLKIDFKGYQESLTCCWAIKDTCFVGALRAPPRSLRLPRKKCKILTGPY